MVSQPPKYEEVNDEATLRSIIDVETFSWKSRDEFARFLFSKVLTPETDYSFLSYTNVFVCMIYLKNGSVLRFDVENHTEDRYRYFRLITILNSKIISRRPIDMRSLDYSQFLHLVNHLRKNIETTRESNCNIL